MVAIKIIFVLQISFLGRLHASEFDESFLGQISHPVQSFLINKKGKEVNVKIMCFTKLKQKIEKSDLSKPKGKGIQKGEKMVVVSLFYFIVLLLVSIWLDYRDYTRKKNSEIVFCTTFSSSRNRLKRSGDSS